MKSVKQQQIGGEEARIQIRVPAWLKEEAVQAAFERGVTLSLFVREALERYLEELKKEKGKKEKGE